MGVDTRLKALLEALGRRVLVLDGAMGTEIQGEGLGPDDFGGPALEGCNENLNLTRPDVIEAIHERYLEAGADIIETNTFGATKVVLADYGLEGSVTEINLAAAQLARRCADRHSTLERPRWVAGSMGPTTRAISVTGGIRFEELVENFREQALALIRGGVDFLLLETCQDTRNVKAAILGIEKARADAGIQTPLAISITIERTGTMLGGQGVEAFWASVSHVDLLYVGLNCATGPEFMTDHLRSLSEAAGTLLACVPNAGLPDEDGRYTESPEAIAESLSRFGQHGWLNLVGGCCGTTPAHIRSLAAMAGGLTPRTPPKTKVSVLSGIEVLEVTDDKRPILVGERTNVIGSRKFKRLIVEGQLDEAAEIARAQVKAGAAILDVCLANPDRDEVADTVAFFEKLGQKIKAPLVIDSTDPAVVELALTHCQGKALINSINLEDGEERFDQIVPLAKRYGAALVVGCIDETGMAVTAARKLEVAERSFRLLVETWGVRPEDIYFDPLVFPCGTGDVQYIGSAKETIDSIAAIKAKLPGTRTVLGISNVSFGLPEAGREVLNSVFLHRCVVNGLDLAIVNTEKLERYPSIPEELRQAAADLLEHRGDDPVAAFAALFRDKSPRKANTGGPRRSVDERIAACVVEGSREGLIADLEEKRQTVSPLEIINGPLMAGMDEVGRLFGRNELIVAEVLQSAEVMKAAVDHLEPFMSRADTRSRGRILLATVKGDVHDIGKNLVDIIFSNNGFEVIDLGIKVQPEVLIEAVREHKPDLIGLSGLLVKSAQQMVTTASDLAAAGIDLPILVGGAALTRRFVEQRIAPAYEGLVAYAPDAMTGLELARKIMEPDGRERLVEEQRGRQADEATVTVLSVPPTRKSRSGEIRLLEELPRPPDLDRHTLLSPDLDRLWSFINPMMLYGRHLGLKGKIVRQIEELSHEELSKSTVGRKALDLLRIVAEVKEECRQGAMRPRGVYQFFRVTAEGNQLHVHGPDGVLGTFDFRRQPRENGLCLSDLVAPDGDSIALLVVTAGGGIRKLAEQYKRQGAYLKSHVLQALALETAEAFAEALHTDLREAWGFPDPPDTTMLTRFRAAYRGKRYSFGYPACPDLDDQKLLFELLRPQDVGVELTDGMMMEPEASVSAVVFHHPDATYFSVDDNGSSEEGEPLPVAAGGSS